MGGTESGCGTWETEVKAPKCYQCEGRHWSTQPCPAINRPTINEERLTGAINTVEEATPAINSRPVHSGANSAGRMENSGGSLEASARTPNRRQRADYNAYMKTYMAAYRERRAK